MEWFCRYFLNRAISTCNDVVYVTDHFADLSFFMAGIVLDAGPSLPVGGVAMGAVEQPQDRIFNAAAVELLRSQPAGQIRQDHVHIGITLKIPRHHAEHVLRGASQERGAAGQRGVVLPVFFEPHHQRLQRRRLCNRPLRRLELLYGRPSAHRRARGISASATGPERWREAPPCFSIFMADLIKDLLNDMAGPQEWLKHGFREN